MNTTPLYDPLNPGSFHALKYEFIYWDLYRVTQVYVGNPGGVQRKNSGRHHNQRMSQWEFGEDISYLEHKGKKNRH